MKAILQESPGGPETLYVGETATSDPEADEVLVRVRATALNRADLMQREGRYPPPPGSSEILGLETAGVVEAVGPACDGWTVGDRAFGLLPGGGYAEYVTFDYRMALPIPDVLSFEEAAAVPEVFLTAFQALYWLGNLSEGERVLIHAGASGVGTAAIQLVREAGAQAYVTASAPKHTLCLDLGATLALDYKADDFAERVLEATDGRGVDIILDFIGAPYFEKNVRALAVDGRLVSLALMGGGTLEQLHLGTLFRKRLHLLFTTLRNRPTAYKVALTHDFAARILPLFEAGRLKPIIDSVYDWTDVQEAHRRMGDNRNAGKIVLRVP